MKRHEPELAEKTLTARKYEMFDKIVDAIAGAHDAHGAECYDLLSNNGAHRPDPRFDESKKDDLESRLRSDVTNELVGLLDFPSADKLGLDELKRCLQGISGVAESDAIYQTSMIMKIIIGFIVLFINYVVSCIYR